MFGSERSIRCAEMLYTVEGWIHRYVYAVRRMNNAPHSARNNKGLFIRMQTKIKYPHRLRMTSSLLCCEAAGFSPVTA